ncbi:MAG: hypothetical protein BWY66_02341 [bacterium ADurb.Bin374]|nr:MAG: hypothetical protein BWY66_02341 [bacterium ADurb.Bin374]
MNKVECDAETALHARLFDAGRRLDHVDRQERGTAGLALLQDRDRPLGGFRVAGDDVLDAAAERGLEGHLVAFGNGDEVADHAADAGQVAVLQGEGLAHAAMDAAVGAVFQIFENVPFCRENLELVDGRNKLFLGTAQIFVETVRLGLVVGKAGSLVGDGGFHRLEFLLDVRLFAVEFFERGVEGRHVAGALFQLAFEDLDLLVRGVDRVLPGDHLSGDLVGGLAVLADALQVGVKLILDLGKVRIDLGHAAGHGDFRGLFVAKAALGVGDLLAAVGEVLFDLGNLFGDGLASRLVAARLFLKDGHAFPDAVDREDDLAGFVLAGLELCLEFQDFCPHAALAAVDLFEKFFYFGDFRKEAAPHRIDVFRVAVELRQVEQDEVDLEGADLGGERLVAAGLFGLLGERPKLVLDLADNVLKAGDVGPGVIELGERVRLAVLELRDAGGLFDEGTAGLGALEDDVLDVTLADDRVAILADACIHQHFLDIAQQGAGAVHEVVALA